MSAGSVIIDFLARTGSFETDVARARKSVEGFSKGVKDSFLGNLGAGFARDFIKGLASIPGRMVDVVKGSIDAADHLQDLSQKTGIAVDTLGGLGFAAQQAGGDLESFVAGAGKLNKSLAEAAAGNKEAIAAFDVLGVKVKDIAGNTKTADVALAEIADKFSKLADGPEKVALAIKIFGKAGADMIPVLNEGGAALLANVAYFKRYSGVTVETAKAADQFNDTLTKVHLLQQAFGNNLAAQLLPLLQTLAGRFLAAKEQGDGFAGIAKSIAGGLTNIAIAASFVVETIGAASARLTQFVRSAEAIGAAQEKAKGNLGGLDVFGSTAVFNKGLLKDLQVFNQDAKDETDKARRTFSRFKDELTTDFNDPTNFSNEGRNAVKKKPPAGRLPVAGAADNASAELKKRLDGDLKNIQEFGKLQSQAFSYANSALEGVYATGVLSLHSFFDEQNRLRDAQVREREGQIDKEIALEKKFANDPRAKQTDRIGALDKIKELETERAALGLKNSQDSVLASQRETAALKQLEEQFQSVNAQVLDLQENFAAAAAVKFDLQNDALTKTFTANGNQAGLQAIGTLRAAAIAQAAFQKASLDSSRTLDELALKEDRLNLAVQMGSLTTLEALAKTGDARRAQIPILEAELAILQAQAGEAKLRGTEGADDLIRRAAQSSLALDKIKASADPLAESLNKAFGDDFNSALDDFVTGTKNARQAFEAFGKSVLDTILKMGSKSITESIFGGSGGIGGFISSLFGGQSQGGGIFGSLLGKGSDVGSTAAKSAETAAISASTASLTALTASSGATSAALTAEAALLGSTSLELTGLGVAASAASTALAAVAATSATSSGSSLVSGFASLAGISGGRAVGGPVGAGQTYLIGERGPELLTMGSQGGNVTPNGKWGGNVYHINVPVQGAPNQSRDSAMQQGAAIGLGIQKALARNT